MEEAKKKILVFGSGISGIGAVKLLEERGEDIIVYDGNKKLKEEEIRAKLGKGCKADIVIGDFPQELTEELGLAVLSPGVPTDIPVIHKMRERGVQVIGEVELAYRCGSGDVLAVTGTNGKTTTVSLLGAIMKNYQEDVYVVGNIGNPYTTVAGRMSEHTITVAEMSSFQLESIDTFHPKVSAILNITPDHLNRHHTMEAYVNAKKNIAKNQTEEDYCILNYEDELTREFGRNVKAQVLYFSSQRKLKKGIYLEDGNIICHKGEKVKVCHVDELRLLGVHNYENVMAAALMAAAYKVPMETIRESIKAFQGVEHRIEYVAEKNGVAYYNDSKGTNPDAAMKAVQAMNRSTVLIGGGYDKNSDYTKWIQSFDGKIKKLILLGETRDKIAQDAETCGFSEYQFADTFKEAVHMAAEIARPGEAVLLSPACASWDMFPSYEVRGREFKKIVNSL